MEDNLGKQVGHHLVTKERNVVKDPKIEVIESMRAALLYCVYNIEKHNIRQMNVSMAGRVDCGLMSTSLDGLKGSGATLHLLAQENLVKGVVFGSWGQHPGGHGG
ncbi:hypothetical protein DSO57_1025184 [Entomophthora muscae]|uniref:Uncharacterized protein n=1 Tax=Entomophthora muscae TaxID=34485 RepID=A0ACC2TDW6_9FUNG|nr:hypothetical protein DSO57_1025184 [Entomophthora muscae]